MSDRLFVSFWSLSLSNLPIGQFVHQALNPSEARLLIDQARQNNKLICVSGDDLLAPYKERSLKNHQQLCQALLSNFGIQVAVEDFFSSDSVDGETFSSVMPLELAQVQSSAKLLIITCNYSLPESGSTERLRFEIAPDSVEFHLIAVPQRLPSPPVRNE